MGTNAAALTSYLSRFAFNATGPLVVPIPTYREAATLTPHTANLANAALQDMLAAAGGEIKSSKQYAGDPTSSYKFNWAKNGRRLEVREWNERLFSAELRSQKGDAVKIAQKAQVTETGVTSDYSLIISASLLRTLAQVGEPAADRQLSHAEYALALAARLYAEALPESWREKRLQPVQGNHNLSPAEQFGYSSSDMGASKLSFSGSALLLRDRLLPASDEEKDALYGLVNAFNVTYDKEGDVFELGLSVANFSQDVLPTFAQIFDLAVRILALDANFTPTAPDKPVGGPPV